MNFLKSCAENTQKSKLHIEVTPFLDFSEFWSRNFCYFFRNILDRARKISIWKKSEAKSSHLDVKKKHCHLHRPESDFQNDFSFTHLGRSPTLAKRPISWENHSELDRKCIQNAQKVCLEHSQFYLRVPVTSVTKIVNVYQIIENNYPWIFERNRNCILSPDSDGLFCGLLKKTNLSGRLKIDETLGLMKMRHRWGTDEAHR